MLLQNPIFSRKESFGLDLLEYEWATLLQKHLSPPVHSKNYRAGVAVLSTYALLLSPANHEIFRWAQKSFPDVLLSIAHRLDCVNGILSFIRY